MVDIFSPEKRSKIMSSIRGKDTTIELALRKHLWKEGIRGYRVRMDLPGKPDVTFPKYKVVVFCDGDFWHGYDFDKWKDRLSPTWSTKISNNIARDRKNDEKLKEMGWEVIHFWEWEIRANVEKCKQEIVFLLKRKGYGN